MASPMAGVELAELHIGLGRGALDDAQGPDRSACGCFSQPILKLPSERCVWAPQ